MEQNDEFSTVLETLNLLGDWEERYAYLIDLGRKLAPYPEAMRDEAHKVPGCTSQVWMAHRWQDGRLYMDVDSDAVLVKGLLAILMILYNGQTPAFIEGFAPEAAFAQLALERQLSPNRRNGFFAVASRIRQLAHANQQGSAL